MDREKFFNKLEKHPHLQKSFNAILDIAESEEKGSYTADEIEEKAVIEVRKLRNEVLEEWAKSKTKKSFV